MPSFILRQLDPEFWARVQAKAKAENITVKALILRLLSQWLAAVLLLTLGAGCGYKNPTAATSLVVPPVAGAPATLALAVVPGLGPAGGTAAVSATVTDAFATPVVGASVAFTAAAGTLAETSVVTNEKGVAATTLTAPAGAVLVTATVGSLESKTLVAVQVPVAPPTPAPTPTPTPTPTPDPTQPFTVTLLVTAGFAGDPTTFALASSAITQAAWTFGDGATVTTSGATTTHVYATAGTFPAWVTARSVDGRTATGTATVTISPRPITPTPPTPPTPIAGYTVALVASPASVTVGASTTLTATATALNGAPAANSYAWDCTSDGIFELRTTANTTACSYATAGVVTARVVASADAASGLGTVTISVTPPPAPAYTVTVAAAPTSVVAGASSTLTATVTPVNGAPAATSYAWDCDNNGTVDATTAVNVTSCAYPSAGTITSKVTVTGGTATGTGTTTVTVAALPPLFVGITASTLTPSLAGGGNVTFTATVTSTGAVPAMLQWQWDDTNDGTYETVVAAAASPNMRATAYGSVGAKTVKVRVVDVATGREASGTLTITVAP